MPAEPKTEGTRTAPRGQKAAKCTLPEPVAFVTAVVAAAVGGIPEVVVDGETGFLVPVQQMNETPFEPIEPSKFSRDLALRINELMAEPAKREAFGQAGRRRAAEVFSWSAIAHKTKSLYETLAK